MGSDCLSDPQKNSSIVWLIFSSCEFFYCVFKILGIILSLLIWDQQTISSLILGSLLYLGRGMETQDNGFLLVIDGVRKEKEVLNNIVGIHTIPRRSRFPWILGIPGRSPC